MCQSSSHAVLMIQKICIVCQCIETTLRQQSLHAWCAANQVVFEASKESMHIVDARNPVGNNFKTLSVILDSKLGKQDTVFHFYNEASWRLKTLFRILGTDTMVRPFKS